MIELSESNADGLVHRSMGGPIPADESISVPPQRLAAFCAAGRIVGVLTPGRYLLSAASLPWLASVSGPPYLMDLYFVATSPRRVSSGGPAPTILDPVSHERIQPRHSEVLVIQVKDPALLLAKVLAAGETDPEPSVVNFVRCRAAQALADALGAEVLAGRSLLDLAKDPSKLATAVRAASREWIEWGLELVDLVELRLDVSAAPVGTQDSAPLGEVAQESVYEMLWDCKYCGQRQNLGLTHRCCPNCGAPQDPSWRYFPSDDQKVAVEDHPYVGVDVICPACRDPNSRASKHCRSCGSPLGAGQAVATRADQVHAEGAFAGDSSGAARAELANMGAHQPAAAPSTVKKRRLWPVFVVVFAVLGLTLVLLNVFHKREAGLEVVTSNWQRSIEVESYARVRSSVWCSDAPAGAREISRTREKRSVEKVADGEECKSRKKDRGDGTFKETRECTPKYREQAVFDDKCSFDVMKWTKSRTETARGGANDSRRWPVVNIVRTGTVEGSEREGSRSEQYQVTLREPGKNNTHECTFSEAEWARFAPGQRYRGQKSPLTGSLDCGSLSRLK